MMAWLQALLLLAGDIETNPGPPKNRGGPPGGVYIAKQRLGQSDFSFQEEQKNPQRKRLWLQ